MVVHICVSLLNQQTVHGGVEGLQARLQASLQAKLAERKEKRSNGLARSRASHSGNDRDQHTNNFREKIQSVIGRVDGAVALHDAKAAGVHQRVGATSEYTETTRAVFMEQHGIHGRDTASSVADGRGIDASPTYTPTPPNERLVGISYSTWFPKVVKFTSQGGCTWGEPALGAYQSSNRTVICRAREIGGSGGSPDPPGPLPDRLLHARIDNFERFPALLNRWPPMLRGPLDPR
jgi:hypothetical protein